MKATIKDVAKFAGVSVATVSRYLNHSPLIAEASVEKVRQAIEALDYQPSMMARGLLHGNSKTIALAVDDSNTETYGNDFFLKIQYGLEHELTCNGYYLMICHVGTGADAVSTVRTLINENRIDGLVLLSEMAHGELLELLRDSQIPFVIAGRSQEEGTLWVDIDNIEAGHRATERLLQTGVKRVGFLTNSFDKMFVSERFQGYCNALKAAGIEKKQDFIADGLTSPERIATYTDSHKDALCEAYVASDSTIAFYFLRELYKRGIRVPEQVQVIGFDDSVLAAAADPAMTVVEIDVTKLGVSAAKLLMKQLQATELRPGQSLLPVGIIERASTK